MRLIDADKFLISIASIAKTFAKSDAQQALMGRVMYNLSCQPTISPTAWIATKDKLPEDDLVDAIFLDVDGDLHEGYYMGAIEGSEYPSYWMSRGKPFKPEDILVWQPSPKVEDFK